MSDDRRGSGADPRPESGTPQRATDPRNPEKSAASDAFASDDRGKPTSASESAAGQPTADHSPAVPVCEICGTLMYDRHCKIVCPGCGYLRDCSDP